MNDVVMVRAYWIVIAATAFLVLTALLAYRWRQRASEREPLSDGQSDSAVVSNIEAAKDLLTARQELERLKGRVSQLSKVDREVLTLPELCRLDDGSLWTKSATDCLAVYIRPRSGTDFGDDGAYQALIDRIVSFAQNSPAIVRSKATPGAQVATALVGASDLVVVAAWNPGIVDALDLEAEKIAIALHDPYTKGRHAVAAEASAGWDYRRHDQGVSIEMLIGYAEIACRTQRGVSPFERARHTKNVGDARVREALENDVSIGAFENCNLLFQPKFRYLRTNADDATVWELVGVEALIRWIPPDPTLGCSPPQLLNFIRDRNRMGAFNSWLVDRAIEAALSLESTGAASEHKVKLAVSINVYPRDFTGEFLSNLRDRCNANRLEYQLIELELVESGELSDACTAAVTEAKKSFGFALDDFGTDRSNLDRIDKLASPNTTIKLDRAIIRKVLSSRTTRSKLHEAQLGNLVRAWTDSGLLVVAEGVEEQDDASEMVCGGPVALRRLVDLGIKIVQGFVFAKPMPLDVLLAGMRNGTLLNPKK